MTIISLNLKKKNTTAKLLEQTTQLSDALWGSDTAHKLWIGTGGK